MTRALLVLLAAAMLLAPASATTLTVTLSHASTGSVSEPLIVTVQVAAASLSAAQVSVGVTLADNTGGTFSIASATQTLTFTTNSTQTVTWSATPVQAGTHSAPFTVTAKVNGGSSSDTPGTATSAGAVAVTARPVLEVTCNPATTSAGPGVAVPVTCSFSNPSGRNVTNVQACLATSGNVLTVTLTSSLPTQTQSFTFGGVSTISLPAQPCYNVGTVGSVFALSWQVSGNAGGSGGNGGAGGGGGGGGGGGTPGEVQKETPIAWSSVPAGEFFASIPDLPRDTPVEVPVEKAPVTALVLEASHAASGGDLAVRFYRASPSGVPAPRAGAAAYGYLEITIGRLDPADLKASKVRFQVERSWAQTNGVDPATVVLHRYLAAEKRWQDLPTLPAGESGTHHRYEAETPGFSIFAITGKPKTVGVTGPGPATGPEVSLPGPGTVPREAVVTGGLSSPLLLGIGAAAIGGAAEVAFVLLRKRNA